MEPVVSPVNLPCPDPGQGWRGDGRGRHPSAGGPRGGPEARQAAAVGEGAAGLYPRWRGGRQVPPPPPPPSAPPPLPLLLFLLILMLVLTFPCSAPGQEC